MGGVRGCTLRVAARRQIVSAGGDFERFGNLPAKKAAAQAELRADENLNRRSALRVPVGRFTARGASHAPSE